jgi:two-component system sensor histidine kinase/response regulator
VIVLSDGECDLPDGASGVVSRPAEASALLTVLMTAVGANDSPRMQTPRRRAPDARLIMGALRVLLAEDNPVNQTLAVRMLERMGTRGGRGRQRSGSSRNGSWKALRRHSDGHTDAADGRL